MDPNFQWTANVRRMDKPGDEFVTKFSANQAANTDGR